MSKQEAGPFADLCPPAAGVAALDLVVTAHTESDDQQERHGEDSRHTGGPGRTQQQQAGGDRRADELQRHGFVEEDKDRGSGRERWWKPVSYTLRGPEAREDPALVPPVRMMLQSTVEHRATTLQTWLDSALTEPEEWINASVMAAASATMTLAQAEALRDDVHAVLARHLELARSGDADPDSADVRRMRVYFDSVPLPRQ